MEASSVAELVAQQRERERPLAEHGEGFDWVLAIPFSGVVLGLYGLIGWGVYSLATLVL